MKEYPDRTKPRSNELLYKVTSLFTHLLTFPLFIIAHKSLPDLDWNYHIDRILLGVLCFGIVELFYFLFKRIITLLFITVMIILTIGSISGDYGFVSVYKDYKYMLFAMNESPYPIEVITSKLQPFPEKQAFINAADFENPLVRNFALKATREHFLEEKKEYYDDRQLIQCLAVFKEINKNWNYVHDPKFLEYFAKASESVQHLSGDCDDYSILMYSCIKAIGGKPRIVSTTGHVYPELFIGNENDMERINYIIKSDLFKNEASSQRLNYHVNERGEVWLNLDYTAKYPGGEFMHPEILAVLEY